MNAATVEPDAMSPEQLEEWFLEQLESDSASRAGMIEALASVHSRGLREQADSWAELLQEVLTERSQIMALLKLRASWHETDSSFRAEFEEIVAHVFLRDRTAAVFPKNIGLSDSGIPLRECVRRLELLLRLDKGVLCFDKTWGFGVVDEVDGFYQQVTVDFRNKPEHVMSLSHAAESVELLDEDHLLARHHADPDAVRAMSSADPAALFRLTLKSFGPLTLAQMKELLTTYVMSDSQWKTFWDAARKRLKDDPLVEMPTKRTDPFRLLDHERDYGDDWFAALAGTRDLQEILARIEDVLAHADRDILAPEQRKIVGDRLAFLFRGAGRKQGEVVIRAAMLADRAGVSADQVDVPALLDGLCEPARFLALTSRISAKLFASFVGFLLDRRREAAERMLLENLTSFPITSLNEVMNRLLGDTARDACVNRVQAIMTRRHASVELLCWLAGRLPLLDEWQLGIVADVAGQMVTVLERKHSGEHLKARKQLAGCFEKKQWLADVMVRMTASERSAFMSRLNSSSAWATVDRQSIMAKIIKLYPELHEVLLTREEEQPEQAAQHFTSWRSYATRQKQLENLVNVEIPRNSKDIATARSYGDLRENFEYKTAKEMQTILYRRRDELQADLQAVRGYDFASIPADAANMGTTVCIQYPGGHTAVYTILGEWDTDEQLGIISSRSRLAEALRGHKEGDKVILPTEDGEQVCTLLKVDPLSDDIKKWVMDTPT